MNAFSHIKWESLRSCSNSYRTYCKIMISYCFGACSTCDVTCQRLWLLSEIWQRNHECLDHSHSMNPGRLQISCNKWALYEIMKIIPFTPLAGTEKKKKVYKMQSHHGISLIFFSNKSYRFNSTTTKAYQLTANRKYRLWLMVCTSSFAVISKDPTNYDNLSQFHSSFQSHNPFSLYPS